MTNQQHPITPPRELVEQWRFDYLSSNRAFIDVAKEIARWGADQELEACKQYMHDQDWFMSPTLRMSQLHNARRPKPPSLKEQLLQKLEHIRDVADKYQSTQNAIDDLRETLEALPND
jgi:hypothetical protein